MNLMLVQSLASSTDIRSRCSTRAQLETCGLLPVLKKAKRWNEPSIMCTIRQYEEEAEYDRRDLAEERDQLLLKSMRSPEDVFRALLQTTKGSKASSYLLNSLRHLLIIKEDGDQKVRYFQLIDQLIGSIVMGDTPDLGHDFSRAFGVSVSHLMGKFVEQEKLDNAIGEVKELKLALAKETREKVDLMEEINSNDLVSSLKSHIVELEERLRKSRAATEAVTDQMEGMRRDYETRIQDLEMIIQELFNMLRESNHLDQVKRLDDGPINRAKLIYDLREQWERKKTISKLEGRALGEGKRKPKSNAASQQGHDETDGEEEEEEGQLLEAEKVALGGPRRGQNLSTTKAEKTMSGSQFMDAPEERVRAHIEGALSKEADHIVSQRGHSYADLPVTNKSGSYDSEYSTSRCRDESTRNAKRASNRQEIDSSFLQKAWTSTSILGGAAICATFEERVRVGFGIHGQRGLLRCCRHAAIRRYGSDP